MDKLISLYERLDIPSSQLVVIDDNTGAGYISQIIDEKTDNVVVRWGSYQEGIRVLEAYRHAASLPYSL